MKTSVFKNPETMPTNRASEEIRLLGTLKKKERMGRKESNSVHGLG